LMIEKWEDLYWEFFQNTFWFIELLNNCIKTIDDLTKFKFVYFLSHIKKHLTLALFSSLRQHHVQTGMDLRQVLEATSWAIYALWNSENEKFCTKKENWSINVPEKLGKARNKWIQENFPEKSKEIVKLKDLINWSVAHSDLIYTFLTLDAKDIEKWILHTPFFDIYDEYKVKNDLWFVANVTMGILDLFVWANDKFKVFQFEGNFLSKFRLLINQNNQLKLQMMNHPRFIKTLKDNSNS
jgi:hypothetical protein